MKSAVRPPEWPIGNLEKVGHCPVCKGAGEETYSELTDTVFKCAFGEWTFNSCLSCGSGYLDPRPDRESIGLAYKVYYTHGTSLETKESKILPNRGLIRKAINGRLKIRYGITRRPISYLLGFCLNIIPFIGSFFDPLGRSLHRPPFKGATLLDFGCGDGRFLIFASEMGWRTVGVDFDNNAVLAAKKLGLDVRLGGFEKIQPEERFDAITMSHVIEHMHDPIEAFSKCYSLLNSGGQIAIETPNFDAFGRERFGKFWRGLECPRHLVIFNEKSLGDSLKRVGFTDVKCTSRHFISLPMHAESRCLRDDRPSNSKSMREILNLEAIYDGIRAVFLPSKTEFLKFTAVKP
jgi:2-polyprenyl-3-methyl-5-hydroxy-6-metoxy-1,4-benzoquinol methylase